MGDQSTKNRGNKPVNLWRWDQYTNDWVKYTGSVDEEGRTVVALERVEGNVPVSSADTYSIDAFGRWRVSHPVTIFDSKNVFDDDGLASNVENQPLFYDNQETSGGGTSTSYSNAQSAQTLTVGATTAGTRVRQTKMRFNYQPGKSQLVLRTFLMGGASAGITRRTGMFDANNGLFLEDASGTYKFVRRTNTSGSPVDNAVLQSNWNIDTMNGAGASGITLDFTKTQILFFDFEWLGVGRVRMGFVIDGKIYYAHEFLNTNNLALVYMQTPNLPLRSEITNSGSGAAASFSDICSSVISEGGQENLGVTRYASTGGTAVVTDNENELFAVLGIRLKAEYLGATVDILNVALQLQTASITAEWQLIYNPSVADTFTYADQTNSAVQIATGATANSVTGGTPIAGGFLESGGIQSGSSGSGSSGISSALRLGSLIAGTVDSIVLAVRPVGGDSAASFEGGITWRELV